MKEVGESDSAPDMGLETPSSKGGAMVTTTDKTPAVWKSKKLGIKRVKKKPDLNISKGKLKSVNTPKNFSFLNMSVQKQTLRANNRALAQNLSKARQDIRQLNTEVQMLRSQNQEQCVELNRLKRLVGLKDEEIQQEVQQRLQDEMQGMRLLVEELTQSMMKSSTYITKMNDKCLMYCSRRSTDSSRSVSLGSSQGNQSLNQLNSRSSYKDLGSKDDLMAKYLSKADEFTAPPGCRVFTDTSNSADMSIIAEQSMLDDNDDVMYTAYPLTSLEETSNEVSPADTVAVTKPLSKLPQRVLKYTDTGKSNGKTNASDLTGKNTELSSDDIDLTKIEKSGKSATSRSKSGKKDESQSAKCKDSEKVKGSNSDDDHQINDRNKAKQISKENVSEHQQIDLDADVSAFGFGGSFAADLVSGSPIPAEKRRETFVLTKETDSMVCKPTDMKKRRETFVKSKEIEISEDKISGKEGNEKLKGTFAVPKAPLQNSVKEKKDNRKGNDKKTSGQSKKENNDKLHLKTKEKRRETYAAENPFVPKIAKVQRSPIKQMIGEDSVFDSVADPFKPTKTLIRSPVHASVEKASPEKKIDSLAFLAKFRESLEGKPVESLPLPDPEIPDEPTTYFNSEMDFTSVIDSTKLLQTFNKSQKNSPAGQMKEDKGSDQRTNSLKNQKQHEASKSKCLGKTGSSEKVDSQQEITEAAAVEVRTKKPGVFTFSVARKEADGTRKAIPEKVSKARSKKKHLTPEKEERKTGPDRDMFNFGDRTPTMPFDKLSKAKNVYDLSMNESVAAPHVSLKNFNEKEPQKKTESKEQDQIYYVPLKESSEENPTSKRARSQSRSRSKSRKTHEDDDEDWVPGGKSHARSKSRGRSSSEGETTKRRGRSKSCRRVKNDNELDEKEITSDKVSRARSRSRSSKVESEEIAFGRRGRSRSQARTINYDENTEEDEETADCSREIKSVNLKGSHVEMSGNTNKLSRSKTRKERDVSEEKESRRGRSRSRARPVKDNTELDSLDIENTSEQENTRAVPTAPKRSARSKSQARKPFQDGDSEDFESSPKIERKSRSRSVHRRKTHEMKASDESKSEDDNTEIKKLTKDSGLKLQNPKTVPVIVVPDSDDNEFQDTEDSEDSKKASKEKPSLKKSEQFTVVHESESDSENIQKLERSRRKSRRDAKSSKYDKRDFESDLKPNENKSVLSDQSKTKKSSDNFVTDIDGKEFIRNSDFINKRRNKSQRIPDVGDDNEENKVSENTEESCDVSSKKKSVNSEYVDNRHAESPKINKKAEEVKISKSVKKSTKKRKTEDTDTKSGKSRQNINEKLDKDGTSMYSDEIEKSSVTPAKVPEGNKKSARSRTGKSSRKVKKDPLPDQTPITKDGKTNNVADKPDALALLKKRLTMVGMKHSENEDLTKDEEKSRKRSKDELDGHQIDESESPENKRSRRNRNPVSYVPKPLNVKLRQGDKMYQECSMSKVKAEQTRLAIAKKMSVPKISSEDKENIQQT